MPMALLRVPKLPAATNLTVALPSTAAGRKPGKFTVISQRISQRFGRFCGIREPLVRLLTLSTSRTLPAVTRQPQASY